MQRKKEKLRENFGKEINEKDKKMEKEIKEWDKEQKKIEEMRKRLTMTEGKKINNKGIQQERERIKKIVEEWEKIRNKFQRQKGGGKTEETETEWQEVRRKYGKAKEKDKEEYIKEEIRKMNRYRRRTPGDGHCTYHSIIRATKEETEKEIEYNVDKTRKIVMEQSKRLYEEEKELIRGTENGQKQKNKW